MSPSPLLIICGPTATGKTHLALKLAQKFHGQILSADSRQVYQGLNAASGKGLPPGAQPHTSDISFNDQKLCYFLDKDIPIWGYDLVKPQEDFSAAHFYQAAQLILPHIWSQQNLPIVTGGTGFYIKTLITSIPTLFIPPDPKLRLSLSHLSVEKLQHQLRQLDSDRVKNMNSSDLKNPRRLIRAIEVAKHPHSKPSVPLTSNFLMIGLTAPLAVLDQRIHQNILSRADLLHQEFLTLSDQVSLNSSAFTTLGYSQWRDYLLGKTTRSQAIKLWYTAEIQYARRQLTWFRQFPQIKWFDISQPDFTSLVDRQVKAWYTRGNT